MAAEELQRLHALFESTTLELLASFEIEVEERKIAQGVGLNLGNVGAIIGFAGDGVSGSLSLAMSNTDAERLSKRLAADNGAGDLLGELANQLLGRVRRKLLLLGLPLACGTPVIVRGNPISLRARLDAATLLLEARTSEGPFYAWLSFVVKDGFKLSGIGPTDPVPEEGDTLLF